jgi:hypothetical protein
MCPQIGVRTYGPSVLDRRLGCRFRNVIPGRLDEVDARRWHVESAAVWLMSTVLSWHTVTMPISAASATR